MEPVNLRAVLNFCVPRLPVFVLFRLPVSKWQFTGHQHQIPFVWATSVRYPLFEPPVSAPPCPSQPSVVILGRGGGGKCYSEEGGGGEGGKFIQRLTP